MKKKQTINVYSSEIFSSKNKILEKNPKGEGKVDFVQMSVMC